MCVIAHPRAPPPPAASYLHENLALHDIDISKDPSHFINIQMFSLLYDEPTRRKWLPNKFPPSFDKIIHALSTLVNWHFRKEFCLFFYSLGNPKVSLSNLICSALLDDPNISVDTKQMLAVNWNAPGELRTIIDTLPLDVRLRNKGERERIGEAVRSYLHIHERTASTRHMSITTTMLANNAAKLLVTNFFEGSIGAGSRRNPDSGSEYAAHPLMQVRNCAEPPFFTRVCALLFRRHLLCSHRVCGRVCASCPWPCLWPSLYRVCGLTLASLATSLASPQAYTHMYMAPSNDKNNYKGFVENFRSTKGEFVCYSAYYNNAECVQALYDHGCTSSFMDIMIWFEMKDLFHDTINSDHKKVNQQLTKQQQSSSEEEAVVSKLKKLKMTFSQSKFDTSTIFAETHNSEDYFFEKVENERGETTISLRTRSPCAMHSSLHGTS